MRFAGKGSYTDVPRKEIVALAKELPDNLALELIRDYDMQTIKDNAGVQYKISRLPVKYNKDSSPRMASGKILAKRQEYKDLDLKDQLDVSVSEVRNYDALLKAINMSDEELANNMIPQKNTIVRKDLEAAILNSVNRKSFIQQGPGQVGSHGINFKPEIAEQNAVQYLYDMNIDRALRTMTVLPQQGHSYSKSQYPDKARDIKYMRGQEGKVNWKDGDGQYVNLTREQNLLNGRKESFNEIGLLLNRLRDSGASEAEMNRYLDTAMKVAGF